jgi:hypothetical protein
MSYFSASFKVNPEGDVLISDDIIQGLGIIIRFLHPLFATFTSALVSIYEPPHRTERHHGFSTDQALDADFFWQEDVMADDDDEILDASRPQPVPQGRHEEVPLLIAIIPHPGYFVAVCLIAHLPPCIQYTDCDIGRHKWNCLTHDYGATRSIKGLPHCTDEERRTNNAGGKVRRTVGRTARRMANFGRCYERPVGSRRHAFPLRRCVLSLRYLD